MMTRCNFKCLVQPPETQRPHQGNQFRKVEQLYPRFPGVVVETPQVPRVKNQTPPTLRVEPIERQIHVPEKHSTTPATMVTPSISLEDELILHHNYTDIQIGENS